MGKKLGILIILLIFSAGVIYILGFQKETVAVVQGSVTVSRSGSGNYELLLYGMLVNVEARFENIPLYSYMTMERGKPHITASKPTEMPDVVNLTILFRLTTPTNKTLEFEPLKLGKGGVHNFTLIIGKDEGLDGTGTFKLEIVIKLKVTTPNGVTVVDKEKVITVFFELPERTVRVSK